MQFSPRVELVELLTPPSEANLLELQRWGLGVSFHEVDLSLGKDIRNLKLTHLESTCVVGARLDISDGMQQVTRNM